MKKRENAANDEKLFEEEKVERKLLGSGNHQDALYANQYRNTKKIDITEEIYESMREIAKEIW